MSTNEGISSPGQVAIVGVGNVLLSDEGVGIHAVRALREREISMPCHVRIFELGTRGLEILEAVQGFGKAIIIDAVKSGAHPGSIRRWELGELLDTSARRMVNLHEIDLLAALKIGRATARLPDEVVIIGVEPKILSPGLELSPEVKGKMQELIELVLKESSKVCHGDRCNNIRV
jgi:hydrogenase maturation protease